jgi:hypothetical protein
VKTLLKISLLSNAGLIVLLVFVLSRQNARTNMAPMTPSEEERQIAHAGRAQPLASREPEAQSFDWSRIESPDYRTYIANLRSIGCPEQTIRDIITADLDALYASKCETLRQKMSHPEASVAGSSAQNEIEITLESLGNEEAATLAALLGSEPSPARTAVSAAAPSSIGRRKGEAADVFLPLVFQPVDTGALKLNDRQAQAISEMQQWFTDQVGGLDQDPGDPAYRERWLKVQPQMNDMMRGMLGVNAFEEYQLAARASQQKAGDNP